MLSRHHWLLVISVVLLAVPAGAQERVAHPSEVSGNQEFTDRPLRIELPVYYVDSPTHSFLTSVTFNRPPPSGSLIVRYAGLQGLVVKRVQSKLRSVWKDSITAAWRGGVIDDRAYQGALEDMGNRLTDFDAGGPWWERSWLDSLPEEKGGAPSRPIVVQIGEQTEVLRIGPLSLTNDFRVRYSDSYFNFRGSVRSDDDDREQRLFSGKLLGVPREIESGPVSWSFLTELKRFGGEVKFRCRPSVSIRFSAPPSEMIRQVSVRFDAEVRCGTNRSPWPLKITVIMSAEPAKGEGLISFCLVI